MKEYEFAVILNNGYCDDTIIVEANDIDEAYDKASDEIADALQNFPVCVWYNVECVSEPEEDDEE